MFETNKTVAQLIEEQTGFRPISTGWLVGKCQLPNCNDYKERAGFKVEGNEIGWNCYNCSSKARYTEHSGEMNKTFRKALVCHGVDESEIDKILSSSFFSQKKESNVVTLAQLKQVKTTTPETKLPEGSLPLGHDDHYEYQESLIAYLLERKIDLDKYKFFYSFSQKFINRIIIPFYRNGKLIYWQARSIDPLAKNRYENAYTSREAVMFNMDQLRSYSKTPLTITEGVFDAMMFDGVALLGSDVNEAKEKLLTETHRTKLFVLDKDKKGKLLGKKLLERDWDFTFAPASANDLNKSVQLYGKAWTAYQLQHFRPKNKSDSMLALEMNCNGT